MVDDAVKQSNPHDDAVNERFLTIKHIIGILDKL